MACASAVKSNIETYCGDNWLITSGLLQEWLARGLARKCQSQAATGQMIIKSNSWEFVCLLRDVSLCNIHSNHVPSCPVWRRCKLIFRGLLFFCKMNSFLSAWSFYVIFLKINWAPAAEGFALFRTFDPFYWNVCFSTYWRVPLRGSKMFRCVFCRRDIMLTFAVGNRHVFSISLQHLKLQKKQQHPSTTCGGYIRSTGSSRDIVPLCMNSINVCYTLFGCLRLLMYLNQQFIHYYWQFPLQAFTSRKASLAHTCYVRQCLTSCWIKAEGRKSTRCLFTKWRIRLELQVAERCSLTKLNTNTGVLLHLHNLNKPLSGIGNTIELSGAWVNSWRGWMFNIKVFFLITAILATHLSAHLCIHWGHAFSMVRTSHSVMAALYLYHVHSVLHF